MGEHIDWALLRPEMAGGMGRLSSAVYDNSQLSVRERRGGALDDRLDQRLRGLPRHHGPATARRSVRASRSTPEVTDWRNATGLSDRERLAAEFAERFALDHLAMDDELWSRLHAAVHRRRSWPT